MILVQTYMIMSYAVYRTGRYLVRAFRALI